MKNYRCLQQYFRERPKRREGEERKSRFSSRILLLKIGHSDPEEGAEAEERRKGEPCHRILLAMTSVPLAAPGSGAKLS